MFEKVKENLKKVIEISDSCPENYRVKCFEILLEALVKGEPERAEVTTSKGVDVKGKSPFFTQQNIQDEQWQNVLQFDGSNYVIIVKDLKEKTTAKRQIKLALLIGIKNFLETNEPLVPKEYLIEQCKTYSCYNSPNFMKYMRRNKNLFLNKANGWSLTVPGQQEAAKVIKELAQ